ncbi:FAD synthetase family protein [Bacillus sp. AFS040349]|uniref:FAD synthetase family protein n=1 Tax=Bacillus sp. AFS040349 TaxID=2033502 RepID=UPI000BFC5FCC|nr:FAD synthetase family protein [Bacillus sp. AFS040349]PGT76581.1 FAD synthetase [Bacillus sp. AFS040349]
MIVHEEKTLKLPLSILTIGALDGVHRGHQTLISRAKKRALEFGVPLVVYTFDPPPRVFFRNTIQLTTLNEKLEKLRLLGVDHVVVASFDKNYVGTEVGSFLDEIGGLNPLEIWEGQDFHFGKNREGNINTLKERFNVRVLEPMRCSSGEVISSSRIRLLISEKMIAQAEQLLGWDTLKI